MKKFFVFLSLTVFFLNSVFSQESEKKTQLLITSERGGILQLEEAGISIPPGALKKDTVISITRLETVNELGESISNATLYEGGYRFLPAGTKFEKEVIISLPYDPVLNSKPLVLNDTYSYFYDTEKECWVQLERVSIDKEKCVINSKTTHFTDMINATLTMPETANPVDFNLNSIKSLEAAKADTHIIPFNPPKATYTGDAGFSLDFQLPQGRNGIQPAMTLGYSSAAGSGILGKGFDINYGSMICIDTRKSLPLYNENDVYMLDGILLQQVNKTGTYIEYEPLKQTGYQTIRRYNAWSSEGFDYWEITSANGVKSIYGQTADSTVGSKDRIFAWYLTSVQDFLGNSIKYEYFKDSNYVYPDKINYTGFNEEAGKYTINFEYEQRSDVRVDARSGEAVSCKKRLKSISAYVTNSLFRKYIFEYTEGLAKSSLLEKLIVEVPLENEKNSSYEYGFEYNQIANNEYFSVQTPIENISSVNDTSNFSAGFNGYITGGFGVGRDTWDIRTTAGRNFSDSSSFSYADTSYVDINGDGYPDKVVQAYKKSLKVYLYENGKISKDYVTVNMEGNMMDYVTSSTFSSGYNLYVGAGIYAGKESKTNATAGYKFSKTNSSTKTETESTLMDVDGDGLVDIILNPKSYLHNESDGQNVKFSKKEIIGYPQFEYEALSFAEKQKQSKNYLMERPLRVWRAPYDGEIEIIQSFTASNSSITGKTYFENDEKTKDYEIKNNENSKKTVSISKKDNIYFLPNVEEDIPKKENENRNKSMDWNIEIKYTSVMPFSTFEKSIFFIPDETVEISSEEVDGETVFVLKDKELNAIYSISSDKNEGVLKTDWKAKLDNESCNFLANNKKFIPNMITSLEMNKICSNMKKEEVELLAKWYSYDSSLENFYLNNPEEIEKDSIDNLRNLFQHTFINDESFLEYYLKSFNIVNIKPEFKVSGQQIVAEYVAKSEEIMLQTEGENENVKTGTSNFGSKYFNINLPIGNTVIERLEQTESGIWQIYPETTNIRLISILSEKEFLEGKNVEYMTIKLEDIETGDVIKLFFSDKEDFVSVLSQEEMEAIVKDYAASITYEQIVSEIKQKKIEESLEDEEENENPLEEQDIILTKEDFEAYFESREPGFSESSLTEQDLQNLVENTEVEKVLLKYRTFRFMKGNTVFKKNGDEWSVIDTIKFKNLYSSYVNYRYKNLRKELVYNTNKSYNVSDGKIEINCLDEHNIFSKRLIEVSNYSFNADKDFRQDNILYTVKVNESSDNDEITFENEYPLYGGRNWYYAFWSGTESENPFSVENMNDKIRPKEIDKEKYKNLNENSDYKDFVNSDNENREPDYSLGMPRKELVFQNNLEQVQEEESTYTLNNKGLYSNLSTVVLTELVEDDSESEDKSSVKLKNEYKYYAALIQGSKLNCSRTGGNAFYKLEGMPDNIQAQTLFITSSESEEKSHSGDISGKIDKTLVEAAVNGTYTTTKGSSNNVQTLRDVNGDHIPDVLVSNGSETIIYLGSIDENDYKLSFTKSDSRLNLSGMLKTENSNKGFGGSLTPGGDFQIQYTKSGSVKGIIFSGAGGSSGTDEQTESFMDINGDGISDKVTKKAVYLGTGLSILNDASDFTVDDKFIIQKSESKSGNISSVPINLLIEPKPSLSDENSSDKPKTDEFVTGSGFDLNASIGNTNSFSSSNVKEFLYDINGDGLVDRIVNGNESSIAIYYNLGNCFASEPDTIEISEWEVERTKEETDNQGQVYEVQVTEHEGYYLQSSSSISTSLSPSYSMNMCAKFPMFLGLKGKILVGYGNGLNFGYTSGSITTRFMDIDGDGLPDQILEDNGKVYYKKNLLGQADLLKTVRLPQGGSCNIEYEEKAPTFNMPGAKMVMKAVTFDDESGSGKMPVVNNGNTGSRVIFEYGKGNYNRKEHDFYGYESLSSSNVDGTYAVQKFSNDITKYNLKGAVTSVEHHSGNSGLYNCSDFVFLKQTTEYDTEQNNKVIVVCTETEYKESKDDIGLKTKETFSYDEYMNITSVLTENSTNPGRNFLTKVSYFEDEVNNIYSFPEIVTGYEISNGTETLLRRRSGEYEDGLLIKLNQYYNDNNYLSTVFNYNDYGLIDKVTDSTGATLEYAYDGVYHQYVTAVTQYGKDTEKYITQMTYDYQHQTKTSEKDLNGLEMKYEYDEWQRLSKVFSPYDKEVPCVQYEYFMPKNNFWYAISTNKIRFTDEDSDNNELKTIVLQDGLGRVIQTAKTGFVYNTESQKSEKGWNVSGAVVYDDKGRIVQQGQADFIPGEDIDSITGKNEYIYDVKLPVKYTYDFKDRAVVTQLPDDTFVTSSFKLVNTNEVPELDLEDNRTLLESSVTDQNGNITQQYSDISGNIVAVAKRDRNLNLLTKTTYEYDLLGQMLKAYDAQKNPVSVKYDLLGRTISLASVDGGEKRYYYDGTPNLMREDDSRLREENRNIVYKYDGLNRLVEINYVSGDKTVFEYGTLTDKIDNLCGRLKSITEKGTSIYYKYGLLGQVEEETRNITAHVVSSVDKEKSATMKYTSDYLGRMQKIIYPDGEVVTYSYDFGGQIYKVTGEKQGEIFDYVNNIGYNEFGQRVYIEYGNGVKTTYTYDPARRWLQNIVTTGSDNILLQNIDYVFDGVGNVMSYTNNCLENGNYSTTQNYEYDNLYQLTKSGGTTILNRYKTSVPDYTSCYEQNFAFDNLGNMTSKGSREWMLNGTKPSSDLNYSFEYNYAEGFVHRLKNAGNRYYEYDPNGNLIREYDSNGAGESEMLSKVQLLSSDDSDSAVYGTEGAWGFGIETSPVKTGINNFERTYTWDDRNRLVQTKDVLNTTNYVYNSNDERVAKYTDRSETLYFNNFWSWHTDPANIYSQGQLSKHIYLGDTRIVTKVSQEVDNTIGGEKQRVFYYHTDHLGSASLVTDYRGNEYERLEYTPYGELWVDLGGYTEGTYIPFKFSAKEMDEETGLYYFGARYLDPKYSMWISADPALGEYIPQAGRDKNEQLPGMGGVYTHINFHLYHYAGNNPVRYADPDGRERKNLSDEQWEIVQFTKENLVKKLSNIIDQLKSCEGDLEKLDSKIIDAARMYLTSEFGTLPMDTKILADILQEGKEHIEKLTREDFKYDDKTKNYAYTFSFFYTITLGKLFFVAPDSGTIDTKEGIILHESTHYFKWLFTVDPTYDNTEMKQLPDSGFWRYKQHNANNWEYFYEILVD